VVAFHLKPEAQASQIVQSDELTVAQLLMVVHPATVQSLLSAERVPVEQVEQSPSKLVLS